MGLYQEAMRVRPEDYQAPLLVAQSYDDLGRPEDAITARQRGIELAEQDLRFNPDDARACYMSANGMAAMGQRERGREWAERALAMRPDDPMLLYNVGCIFSLLGCIEEAIECLERGIELGLAEKGWYEHDSNLDPLRDHRRIAVDTSAPADEQGVFGPSPERSIHMVQRRLAGFLHRARLARITVILVEVPARME